MFDIIGFLSEGVERFHSHGGQGRQQPAEQGYLQRFEQEGDEDLPAR
ncbi:MAG: hypothetical protein JW959_07400 [Pirellulales bacterium]|nr:hypothetical protein [Pirellulales bacterium]